MLSWRLSMIMPIMTRREPIHGGSAAASLLQTVLMGIIIDRLFIDFILTEEFLGVSHLDEH